LALHQDPEQQLLLLLLTVAEVRPDAMLPLQLLLLMPVQKGVAARACVHCCQQQCQPQQSADRHQHHCCRLLLLLKPPATAAAAAAVVLAGAQGRSGTQQGTEQQHSSVRPDLDPCWQQAACKAAPALSTAAGCCCPSKTL
jgi:hypothetical protein